MESQAATSSLVGHAVRLFRVFESASLRLARGVAPRLFAPAPLPAALGPDAARELDAQRVRVLRRRLVIYCLIAGAVLLLSAVANAADLADPAVASHVRRAAGIDILADLAHLALHAGALAFALRSTSRRALVRTASALIALAAAVSIVSTPLVTFAGAMPAVTASARDALAFRAGLETLAAVFLLHFLASLLIAMSPQEGLRPLAPALAFFAVTTLLFSPGSWLVRIALVILSPLAGLPGFAWSVWRHRSFRERFHARAVSARLGDISRELEDARRVHEALFPPPVSRGAVRVHYRYEPAGHIGGDFLFVHPLAHPPSERRGPVSVVLIDVTGHGVAAALAVNRLHDELTRLFAAPDAPAPGGVIAGLNAFAARALAPQGVFATAVCLRASPPADGADEGELSWSSAGHPPALLRRAVGSGIARLDPTAPMLGVLEADVFDPAPRSAAWSAADCVLLYTDGAMETQDRAGAPLGVEGLERIAMGRSDAGRTDAGEGHIADAALRAVRARRPGPPADDTLVVEVALARQPEG